MVLHAFVLTVDATKTDAQQKAAIDAFLVANGITDMNVKNVVVERHARVSERLNLVVTAAI